MAYWPSGYPQNDWEHLFAMQHYHVANGSPHCQDLLEVVKRFWSRPEMTGGYATGRSTERRLVEFVPLGRTIMSRS